VRRAKGAPHLAEALAEAGAGRRGPASDGAREFRGTKSTGLSNRRSERVAYIICEPCIGTKDSACVDVCPVDCIHPRKDEPDFATVEMLYIHPDECIDCGACVPACPVEAIFALDETPEKWKSFIPVNAEYFQK
jgi:NAD-dependent dihydropyrimidine dehydrogenase PreA subunit